MCKGLPVGNYYVKEEVNPDGFELSKSITDVTLIRTKRSLYMKHRSKDSCRSTKPMIMTKNQKMELCLKYIIVKTS
ncbi:MAG: prealbumin-like fold domain-containing protein [Anaerostipes hadrus]